MKYQFNQSINQYPHITAHNSSNCSDFFNLATYRLYHHHRSTCVTSHKQAQASVQAQVGRLLPNSNKAHNHFKMSHSFTISDTFIYIKKL